MLAESTKPSCSEFSSLDKFPRDPWGWTECEAVRRTMSRESPADQSLAELRLQRAPESRPEGLSCRAPDRDRDVRQAGRAQPGPGTGHCSPASGQLTRDSSKFSCTWMSSGSVSTGFTLMARQLPSSNSRASAPHMAPRFSVLGVSALGLGTQQPPPLWQGRL